MTLRRRSESLTPQDFAVALDRRRIEEEVVVTKKFDETGRAASKVLTGGNGNDVLIGAPNDPVKGPEELV